MLWFYRCPNCGQELNVDWPSRLERRTCRHCRREHFAPTPPGMRLLAARPFVCGAVRRLMLNHAWRRRTDGSSKVALIAWPHNDPPDLTHPKGNGTPYAERQHDGTAGDCGNGWLDLDLPDAPGSCWVAAVALTDETGRLEMEECLLTGVE
ncbi:MAG TPA: hypothetical protein ENN51_02025 [candidate division WOR-3 bacterium]|uniref:Uncharacterized protein n=1 Tax=candidate division WOR-3 bacterium TaxID=2052148 RepID=A0A7V0XEI4_UNCW3|nr:hypothetical protein [candidate division WOR-3 bacterium]